MDNIILCNINDLVDYLWDLSDKKDDDSQEWDRAEEWDRAASVLYQRLKDNSGQIDDQLKAYALLYSLYPRSSLGKLRRLRELTSFAGAQILVEACPEVTYAETTGDFSAYNSHVLNSKYYYSGLKSAMHPNLPGGSLEFPTDDHVMVEVTGVFIPKFGQPVDSIDTKYVAKNICLPGGELRFFSGGEEVSITGNDDLQSDIKDDLVYTLRFGSAVPLFAETSGITKLLERAQSELKDGRSKPRSWTGE